MLNFCCDDVVADWCQYFNKLELTYIIFKACAYHLNIRKHTQAVESVNFFLNVICYI